MQGIDRDDSVRVPLVWIAVGISLLLHGLLLWQWRQVPLPPTPGHEGKGAMTGRLRTQIASPAAPRRERAEAAPDARSSPPEAPAARAPRRPVAPPQPPQQRQPQLARPDPAPRQEARSEPAAPAITPQPAAPETDMAALVAANQRRRAAAEPFPAARAPSMPAEAPVAEDERAQRDRAVAANLGSLRAPMAGENSQRGGGIFQLKEMSSEYAVFLFFGWNKDMARNNTQQVEVRRGNNPNIRLAVVRRMIAIIRERHQGDFVWDSVRTGRYVTMSARPADSAELEDFLLREFFF